ACWLARQGYEVHLIDITPLHVQMAVQASANQPEAPLASISTGDACSLPWANGTADAILLLGPLYHLTDNKDRLQALREAHRVLKKQGILMAAGISRFASVIDGLRSEFLKDPIFTQIVERDLRDGQHRNPTAHPNYFTDAYFHRPVDLESEVTDAGFNLLGIYGVEGPGWLLKDFDEWWEDEVLRERILHLARMLETEQSLLGISAHLIAVGQK
ncbi:MAG: class I SAM-dependent methyltransferase, partial [Candidatus Lindowbacteria bacterium]|nr:class I SAM-dependent methyltransferase [Candidatus Lindowbacteria bacterium]